MSMAMMSPRLFRPTATPLQAMISQLGSSRINSVWYRTVGLSQAGGNFVSLTDSRGSGFGPSLLPNGGLGGTAPTVDSNGVIITNGVDSFIANQTASALLPCNTTKRTLVIWAEFSGTPNAWGGLVDSLTAPTPSLSEVVGTSSGVVRLNGPNTTIATAIPSAGVVSCLMLSNNGPYNYTNASQTVKAPSPDNTIRIEMMGRGAASSIPRSNNDTNTYATDPVYTVASAFLSLGRAGADYGIMKVHGAMVMNTNFTYQDRAVIEAFNREMGITMYQPATATSLVMYEGDSISAGALTTAPSFTTPAQVAGTSPGAYMQILINAANKRADVACWAQGGQNLNVMGAVLAPNTTAWTDDVLAFGSPARRALGLTDWIVSAFGSNDIGNQHLSSAQMYANFTTRVARAHAAGFKVCGCTIIPRNNFTGAENTTRLGYNTLMEANSAQADCIAVQRLTDAGGGVQPFADATYGSSSIYRNADGTHLTNLGSQWLAVAPYNAMVATGFL